MNLAELAITKKVVTWMFIILVIAGGIFAYQQLGRFEDPEFTIKEAMVITRYPGATPKEVEEEITEPIETAIQQLPQLKRVTSISQAGLSQITVVIKDKYTKHDLPQVWDELRRKVNDVQGKLPPGAKPSSVNDDFGDVYGMLFALTGKGYSYRELKEYADDIKKGLLLVPGVAKVEITGDRQEAIFVEIARTRAAKLGISLESIYQVLRAQNLVADAGNVRVGNEYIRIQPTGVPETVKLIGNILITSPKTKKLIHLSDIANIVRSYIEVPEHLVYYNGEPALTIGVSTVPGSNVVRVGEAVTKKLVSMKAIIPAGVVMNLVYNQPKIVDASVRGFVISVGEALAIVVAVLLIFMGLQSGLIIAAILLLTVLGTLLLMYFFAIPLQRISLGALIIALGMMVDNAIVIVEGILIKMQQGVAALTAAKQVVMQTAWPLLAATFVGILAFAPIGLSQDSTGEYTATLFYVILISLLLSWIWAVTAAPLFCHHWMKPEKAQAKKDPYAGGFYQWYKKILQIALKFRWMAVLIMVGLLALAVWGFGFIKPGFFPDSTNPMFMVDYWRPQGTDIRAVRDDLAKIEKRVLTMKGVTAVTSVLGQGAQRFTLVYSPEKKNLSYSQLLVSVKDYRDIDQIGNAIVAYIEKNYPNSETKLVKIRLGPGSGAKIEARFSGPNATELRKLSREAQNIMHANPNAMSIRDDWRQRVKVISPVFSEAQARQTGITRTELSDALKTAFSGKEVGVFRELDKLIPIISRLPDKERLDIANIDDLTVWSPLLQTVVPIGQLVSRFDTNWENATIHRRNRILTITAMCEPKPGFQAGHLFQQLQPNIEAIKLPSGYHLEWGGEYESAHDAQVALNKQLPFGFLLMFVLVVLLFNSVRQPLIIWLCVPLSIIGVTAGLLLAHKAFEFMAMLGFLSLTGMLIKNAVVLVDQIDLEIRAGKDPYDAIIDSSISRMRPVVLAAVTTVLGMLPLLFDAFFVSMAVVIMFGLTFATILTLVIVPVLYSIFFKVPVKTLATSA